MASNIVRPDAQGRVSLARFGVQPGQTFSMYVEQNGRIHLTPVPEDWKEED